MNSEQFVQANPLPSRKLKKAIRESDFYRDSESIGMRSDIIGCLAPSSSEKRTVIIGLHRDHR